MPAEFTSAELAAVLSLTRGFEVDVAPRGIFWCVTLRRRGIAFFRRGRRVAAVAPTIGEAAACALALAEDPSRRLSRPLRRPMLEIPTSERLEGQCST